MAEEAETMIHLKDQQGIPAGEQIARTYLDYFSVARDALCLVEDMAPAPGPCPEAPNPEDYKAHCTHFWTPLRTTKRIYRLEEKERRAIDRA